jgi:hypothetical protein
MSQIKSLQFLFCSCFIFLSAGHQGYSQISWSGTFGGNNPDDVKSVQQTRDSCFVFAGKTKSFGAGGEDFLVVKTNPAGDTLWTKTYGGANDDNAYAIQQTYDGGYIITGYTTSSLTGGYDVWLIKTDESGDTCWMKTIGGQFIEWALSVQQTFDSGYIITGFTDHGKTDALLIRTNSAGDTLWTKTFGGSEDDWTASVKQTADSGFILTGFTRSFSSNGSEDLWIIKTNASGEVIWSKTYGGSGDDWGRSIAQTIDGGFIIAGGTTSYSAGGSDLWLLKTTGTGDSLWARSYGGSEDDWAYASLHQTPDHGYIIVGSTQSMGFGSSDVWLIKTDQIGDPQWIKTYGGIEWDYGCAVYPAFDKGYIIAGGTQSFGSGAGDAFLIKTDSAGNTSPLTNIDPAKDVIDRNAEIRICPNPCRLETSFLLSVPENGNVILEIADIRGTIVRKLVEKELVKGSHSFKWNIFDDHNAFLDPGIYICTMKLNNLTVAVTKCMILQ